MAEPHHHGEDRSAFYLEQLFAIGVCGALAAVTVALWQTGRLNMLAERFRILVALGGLCLLGIVIIRAIAVWRSVDEEAEADKQPAHEHGPDCDHSHGCDHDHDHHEHHHEHEYAREQVQPVVEPGGVMSLALTGAVPHSHSHAHGDHDHGWAPWRYVVLLLPVVLYFLVLSNPSFDRNEPFHDPSNTLSYIQNFIIIFRSILWEAMPFIVLGAVIAGMLEELLPQRVLVSLLPRNRFLAIAIGGLLGLIFPMCECGIIPIMRRLLRKGLPLSCCIAYVLAGPIVNVVVILSTVAAFSSSPMESVRMTGLRVGLGYLTAVIAALFVEWQHRKHGDSLLTPLARPSALAAVEEETIERRPLWQRINNITETALHDFVDITVFLILGALLAASTRMFLTQERIAELSHQHILLTISLMMGLAIALCLCSEADAFVAASFSTLRPSAKLAFLVLGPMIDFKLYFMYTRVFRPRLILTIYTVVIIQVFLYSYASDFFLGAGAPPDKPLTAEQEEEVRKKNEELAEKVTRTMGLVEPAAIGASHHVSAIATAAMLVINPSEHTSEITFLELENASQTPEKRHFYQGKRVYLRGRFSATPGGGFTLVRWKVNCCVADATPLKAAIFVAKEVGKAQSTPLPTAQLQDQWVRVTGEVRFLEAQNGTWYTALVVTPTERETIDKLIEVVPPDTDPFVY